MRPSDHPPLPEGSRLFTIRQVAARLQISDRSVRRLIAAGKLPVVRLGRVVRIHPRDLRDLERPE